MALPLSPNIAKAVERLFSGESKAEVVRLLTEQCADNLPNSANDDEYGLEDRRFAVLKLSDGDIEKLRAAVRPANQDWRDLFAEAGSLRKYKRQLLGRDLERNPRADAEGRAWIYRTLIFMTVFAAFLVLRLFEASDRTLFGAALLLVAFLVLLFGFVRDPGRKMFLALFVGLPAVLAFLTASIIRWIASVIPPSF